MRTLHSAAALIAAAAAVIGLTACGGGSQQDYARQGTVLLVATATANEPAPALPNSAHALLERAAQSMKGTAQVLIPKSGQVEAQGPRIPVTVMRGDEVEQDPTEMARGLVEITGKINDSLSPLASGQIELDLLSGLVGAARLAENSTIVALSSGLQTTGLADFAGLGWSFDPAAVAADLDARGFIPNLQGREVYFVGLGEVAGEQRALPTPMRIKLEQLWLRICETGGARTCEVLPPSAEQTPSADRTGGVKTVSVPVFALEPLPVGAATTDWNLDSDTLFGEDSAVLLPASRAALAELAGTIAQRGARVEVTGHTWKVGPADGARELSLRRAHAVADALIATGMPSNSVTSVRGAGYDEPVVPETGQGEAAANRSVTLRLTTTA
ncbi:OmpA family protein [Rhodococcus sp. GOMB7]|jgi:outer membrane protein OmpA-like peptidoglycan-associated protein|uniref:OmpA family protein n=1 Tax=unclassified Rhodococcus (in: high G+C Gram-positive bacteria) TaxID=192944 RepID=UPI0015F70DDE|nr:MULTISPECIES: OmpA family protein [unclassified Rhodococcus (in: high G+C Gram-positive bacteria)]MBT9298999.1 OmpA family protein [Rhodococcus sp. GOMB7]